MSRYTPILPGQLLRNPGRVLALRILPRGHLPGSLRAQHQLRTQQGAGSNGPAAILRRQRGQIELYDEELQLEPYKEIGIHTLPPIDTMDGGLGEVITELFTAETGLLDDGKFPVAIGGEHALTPPLVSAVAQRNSRISASCRSAPTPACATSIRAIRRSSACAMRRVVEICPAVQDWPHPLHLRGWR